MSRPEFFVTPGDGEKAPSSRPELVKQAKQLLTLLMETEQTIHSDPDIASTYLNQAIALVAVDNQSEPSTYTHRGGLARWQVSRVDTFISEHIDHCIRTTELASLLGLSASHFSHAFKQTTGVTPLTYVAATRVEAARQDMLCSGRSLCEIALRHGFCDQSHFCRVFKRETGLAPQKWRKLHAPKARLQAALPDSSIAQTAQFSSTL
ncbi:MULTISPECIES: helix-turn-helix domain-containing protein [unclassified Halomonas]|uniref:helix-turn-helix domain-containing protein n=1 Tax=unclassified Halomonas TaxID=2609666 RepID=UPI001CF48963|nr:MULTISPECIES: AraC family transcriptional regulator [unclassified Halomonas]UZH12095.1 AraC family transcriptional regulator [Halomonas sp. BDJS001]